MAKTTTVETAQRIRGFEVLPSYITKEIKIPQRKTRNSAGYDLEAAEDTLIPAGATVLVPTGLKAYMRDDEVLKLYIRSSVAIDRGLRLTNQTGIVDSDYYNNQKNEGHIFVPIYNPHPHHAVLIQKGERIAQAIFCKYFVTDDDAPGGVRVGGMGSTN